MTDEELIEQVARAVATAYHRDLGLGEELLADDEWWKNWLDDARIAIAAMQPRFKAERIRGGEMVKAAAAGSICGLVAKHATDATIADVADQLGQVIRALSVPAIVEAGDGKK